MMKQILSIFLLAVIFCSCGNSDERRERKMETVQEPPKYYEVKENTDLLISPSASSKKLVNEKASAITKTTEFCMVDKTCKLTVLDSNGEYSKVIVVEPDWLSDTYVGWVLTNTLVEFGSVVSEKPIPSKIVAFNNVNNLISELSENGIGRLNNWRSDDAGGYMSITDYYRFGSASPSTGLNNNLAYYLEGSNEAYADKLILVLNIFNSYERRDAIARFRSVAKKSFRTLKLEPPPGFFEALKEPRDYFYSKGGFSLSLEREKNNIESWKITIAGK